MNSETTRFTKPFQWLEIETIPRGDRNRAGRERKKIIKDKNNKCVLFLCSGILEGSAIPFLGLNSCS
jgi:hypothetical protein